MSEQHVPQTGNGPHPLLLLLDLGRRARGAQGSDELAFLVVNDSRLLVPYRQAALWFEEGGVRALSGVVQHERHAPYTHWLNRVCRHLSQQNPQDGGRKPQRIVATDLPDELAAEWGEWLPAEGLWCPVFASADTAAPVAGGVLFAAEAPFGDEAPLLLAEWLDIWQHAWRSSFRPSAWSPSMLRRGFAAWWQQGPDRRWWQRRPVQVALCLLVLACLPVRLSVVAPGELVPAKPAVIRAPLDGVIDRFEVRPNETVKAGQLLFVFDEASIASRLDVARQALATAETEYRQFAQLALADTKSKGQLAALIGKIGEKRAEAEFLATQLERARVVAPQDGLAVFDDPSEWIGRPVQTGERIMRVARAEETEVEAWLAIGDAIPLDAGSPVKLYLSASPLSAVSGVLRYVNHDAVPRPDGTYAYRVRAQIDGDAGHRIGLKGTAKLYGRWAPLGYWVLRRPLSVIRLFLAV